MHPSPFAFSLSQHRVFSSESALPIRWPKYQPSVSASVFPMNIQHWFPLGLTGLISLELMGLSRIFSSTAVWKHQFFVTQPSSWSSSHIPTWLLKKPYLWLLGPLLTKWCLCFLICCHDFSRESIKRSKRNFSVPIIEIYQLVAF